MIFKNIIKDTVAESYLMKEIWKTQIRRNTRNDFLRRLSYENKSVIRIKCRELSVKSSYIKWWEIWDSRILSDRERESI